MKDRHTDASGNYDDDRCFECTGYGDDFWFDDDGNFVSACDTCPYNVEKGEEMSSS